MKHIYITILLACLVLLINFSNIPYRLFLLIALFLGIGINQVLLANSIIKRKMEGHILIRKQRHRISLLSIFLTLTWTLFAVLGDKYDVYIALLFWVLLIVDLIVNLIYKRKLPVDMAVDNDFLYLNGPRLIERNIHGLKKVSLNGLTNLITFTFSGQSALSIDRGNYNDADIALLLKYLEEHSKNKITFTENLRLTIPSRIS